MKLKEENIGQVFKEAFEDYKPEPQAHVWENVLETSKANSIIKNPNTSLVKIASIIGAAAIIAIVSFYIINKNQSADNHNSNIQNKPTIVHNNSEEINNPIKENNKPVISYEENDSNEEDNSKLTESSETEKEIIKNNESETEPQKQISVEEKPEIDNEIVSEKNIIENPIVNNDKPIETEKDISVNQQNKEVSVAKDIPTFDTTSVEFSADENICFGTTTKLKVTGGHSYKWYNGSTESEIEVSPVNYSEYKLTVFDENGNSMEHTYKIEVDRSCTAVMIPNAFTPDGDGINDYFEIHAKGIQQFNIRIATKSGQVVYESNDINQYWDGYYQGKLMPFGVYVYQIIYVDGRGNQHRKMDTFSIIR